jgi:spermidine synthase
MSGLIYEVAWVRSLELIFGATTFAIATVLASFMGGLACGSYCMGRFASRLEKFHPLRVYGVIEVLIGIVAILIPLTFRALVPIYQWVWQVSHASFITFSLIRFLLAALILLVPTFLMGATLPIMSSFVSRQPGLAKKRIGLLYTFNTVGAVLGCVAAGLILFPRIGLAQTQWVAIGFNAAAALGAFLLSRSAAHWNGTKSATPDTASDPARTAPQPLPVAHIRLLVAIYALSGCVAMLYEVAWSRTLVMVLGSSTYAYTIMLATFLSGLAIGAWLGTRFLMRSFSPLVASGLCQLFIALSTFASVFLIEEMPFLYLKCYEAFRPGPTGLLNVQFLLAASLMILPTIGLGAMFPITIQGLNSNAGGAAKVVGWAYALNTLGAIAGSVLAGFWLVPQFGSQKTLLSGIAVNALLAWAALALVVPPRLIRFRPVLPVIVILFCANLFYATPAWDPSVMSSAVFRYVNQYLGLTREAFRARVQKISGEILAFKEGLTCTVTLFRNPEMTSLLVNGKPDASTPSGLNPIPDNSPIAALHDLPTQQLLGQVPLMLVPRRDNVLVIGLGSGVTLGSVLTHPVKSVDCVELEDAVVQASRFFEDYNGRPLADPRTHLIVNDARNHLLVTDQKYDVIISEPSNPWITGAANLFTREAFELSKRRLQPDGVICQWFQLYELQEPYFQTILRTFRSVFPEVHLFRVTHDVILIGSMQPTPLRESELRARITGHVQSDLARIRIRSVEDFLAWYWIGGDELKRAIPPGPFNTDDNMLIEFAAPLQIIAQHAQGIGNTLHALYDDRTTGALATFQTDPATDQSQFWARVGRSVLRLKTPRLAHTYGEASLKFSMNPEGAEVLASALAARGDRARAQDVMLNAEHAFPKSPTLLRALALFHSEEAQWEKARSFAERLLAESPEDPFGLLYLGRSQFHLNELPASRETLQKIPLAARQTYDLPELSFYLGALYWMEKRYERSIEEYRAFLKTDPTHIEARAQLADALYHVGKISEAVTQWQHIGRINSSRADQLVAEARSFSRSGDTNEVSRRLEQAFHLDSNNTDFVLLLARQREAQGRTDSAVQLLEDFLQWHPDRPVVVGYLSQLLAVQKKNREANLLAARYRALTGHAWEQIP